MRATHLSVKKWSSGHPLLGYDVDPRGSFLTVNEAEATRAWRLKKPRRSPSG
jgi:hypothetical protein